SSSSRVKFSRLANTAAAVRAKPTLSLAAGNAMRTPSRGAPPSPVSTHSPPSDRKCTGRSIPFPLPSQPPAAAPVPRARGGTPSRLGEGAAFRLLHIHQVQQAPQLQQLADPRAYPHGHEAPAPSLEPLPAPVQRAQPRAVDEVNAFHVDDDPLQFGEVPQLLVHGPAKAGCCVEIQVAPEAHDQGVAHTVSVQCHSHP